MDASQLDARGCSPLHIAIRTGNFKCVRALVEHCKADINRQARSLRFTMSC